MSKDQMQYRDEEITLRELILKFQEYFYELLRNWLLIGAISLPVIGFFLFQYFQEPKTYTAKITFMVNEDEGNSISSIGSILGQFGMGGVNRRSRYNIDKILQLSRTRNIIGRAIFDSCSIDGRPDYIANHIISIYELDKKWAKKRESMLGFTFKKSKVSDFEINESRAYKSTTGLIIGNPKKGIEGLISNNYEEETGIMELTATSINPHLSYYLVTSLYEKLGAFYIENSTEKQKVTLDLVSAKRDSILAALENAEYALAAFKETNRNVFDKRLKLKEQRLNRDVIVGTTAYAEAVKNAEISDFALKNKTPFIQSIDKPIFPIPPNPSSLLMTLIKASIIGGFIGVLFVLFRKIYRDTMQES